MPSVGEEQARNLRWLLGGAVTLLALLPLVAALLYFGWELPPADMRTGATSSTGYASPPPSGVPAERPSPPAPPGSIPRGAAPEPEAILPARAPGERAPAGEHAVPAEPSAGTPDGAPVAPALLERGRRLYRVNCAMCHGMPGEGIGPVGLRYTPRPPNLRAHVPAHSDAVLLAAITDGLRSTPTPEAARYLPTEWHAFRAVLTPEERREIVRFLRLAFGGAPAHR